MKKIFLIFIVLLFALIPKANAEIAAKNFSVINVQDALHIRVMDNEQLNTTATVTEDGYVNFPFIGSVYVKGKTIKYVEDEIKKRLGEGFIKSPVVSIVLTRGFTQKIYLYGALASLGDKPYEEGLTLLKVLSLAGGITENGLYGRLLVKRKTKEGYEDIELDIENILNSRTGDFMLKPDDIIFVEPNKKFMIMGAVQKSGEYPLMKGMTLKKAFASAGGITEDGIYATLIVRRKTKEGYEDIELDIENVLNSRTGDFLLQHDDIVIAEINKKFIIQGVANKQAEYLLKKSMTVNSALLEYGLIDHYGEVIVRRKQDGNTGYSDIEIYYKGDVRNNLTGNILIHPYDIIIIKAREKYFVYGEINKPGEYQLNEDSTVFTAMLKAGGITKWGSEDRIKILRRKKEGEGDFFTIKVKIGDFIKGDASADLVLEPNDIIVFMTSIL